MLGPVLRLLAIYLCVGLAVWGFFNREPLMALVRGEAPADATAHSEPAAASAVAPVQTSAPAAVPAQLPQPAAQPGPVFAPLTGETPAESADPAAPAAPNAAAPVAPPDTAGLDYQGQWNAARQAYWDGHVEDAIARYRALLEYSPEDGPLNGELANILYTQHRREEAAPYFERAGMAAARAGNHAEVAMLISVLRSISPLAAQRVSDAQVANNAQEK
jgi:hypothetical protein